jgi:hypothetical protein
MGEDRGAFKTNPGDSCPIWAISNVRKRQRCGKAAGPRKIIWTRARRRLPRNFNKRREAVAIVWNEPDSLRIGGARGVATAAKFCSHRVPDSPKAFAAVAEGGPRRSMLPGFRFLFAAIALTMSILVFGLGAAALLRAAHEEFASLPSWHTAPETMFAQPSEASPPVLAMLRIEPRVDEQKAPDTMPAELSPAEPTAEKPSSPEPDEPEVLTAENSDQNKAASAQADTPTGSTDTAETKVAANEAILIPLDEPVALAKIATLSNPAALIDSPRPAKASTAKADKTKPDQDAIRKRLQARQAAQRRRLALRARLAQQQQLQSADPFAQPAAQSTVQPATATPKR